MDWSRIKTYAILAMILVLWLFLSRFANRWFELRPITFILRYAFPPALHNRIKEKHPSLSDQDIHMILEGLRQYFIVCHNGHAVQKWRSFGMPSILVQEAWDEFIKMRRDYRRFCSSAYPHFLPHSYGTLHTNRRAVLLTLQVIQGSTPLSIYVKELLPLYPSLDPQKKASEPRWLALDRVPLLFAIDNALGVEGVSGYDADSFAALEAERLAWWNNGGQRPIEEGGLDFEHHGL